VKYLLDTNILIYLLKRQPSHVAVRMDALPPEAQVGMSFVTWAELLKGVQRSARPDDTRQQLDRMVRTVPVSYTIDHRICAHYAHHSARLKESGTPIGGNDLWIACHALAEDATLVSNNLREFERVPGLRLENWAQA